MPTISIPAFDSAQDLSPMPIEPAWIIAGAPVARAKVLFRSSDRAAWTMLWDCSPGTFQWHYKFDETIQFLEGQVTITLRGGAAQTFGPGDIIFFRKGDIAHWRVEQHVRKLAVCHYPAPAPVGLPLRIWRILGFYIRKAVRQIRGALAEPGLSATPSQDTATASPARVPSEA